MTIIPVYGTNGEEVNRFEINDNISHVNGRVCKGDKLYYKGIGAPYHGQFLPPNPGDVSKDYEFVEQTDVFYIGPYVKKYCFKGKTGIFQEKYQPQFTDYIGSCGVKELSIIENSMDFAKSSVEVIKSVNYDKENGQYYFALNYKCNRQKYEEEGSPKLLYELLEYMIKEDWNFIWDKNSIEDISYNGLVSDVGDVFKSKSISSKLGTIYSVIYSLDKTYPDKYKEFNTFHNTKQQLILPYVKLSIELLERFGVDTSEFNISNDPIKNIKNVVMNYLIIGRNCGDCCYIELGDKIREQYISQTKEQLGMG
jgi:hypothetical protein